MYIVSEILLEQHDNTEKIIKPSFMSFGTLHQMEVAKRIWAEAYKCKSVKLKYVKA